MCGHYGWGPWLSASCAKPCAHAVHMLSAVLTALRLVTMVQVRACRVPPHPLVLRRQDRGPRQCRRPQRLPVRGCVVRRQSVSLICRVCVNHRPVAASIANDLLRACEQLPDGWVAAARAALDDEDVDTAARFLDTVGGRGSVLGRPFASDPTRCCVMALFCALLV